MTAAEVIRWLIWIAAAYAMGSIPFGVILGRLRGIDIREHGSRNIGATNVARTLGKKLGLACFALDVLKGAVGVLGAGLSAGVLGATLAETSMTELILWLGVAIAAILGHMFSIFLRFGGGKGVATGLGAMLAMWPHLTGPALLAVVVWYTTLRLTRYVSLASSAAAASLPLLCILWNMPNSATSRPLEDAWQSALQSWPLVLVTTVLAGIVIWRHRGNLARIRRGEEPKIRGRSRRGDFLDEDNQ